LFEKKLFAISIILDMRVVHLCCVAPPEIGGMGSVALREVTMLRARGVDARLVTTEPAKQRAGDDRSFIERVKPLLRFGNAAVLPRWQSFVEGADVIHLHYPFYGTAEPLLLRSASLPPMVVTFHMDASAGGMKGFAFTLHRWLLQPFLLNHAATVLVSSFDYARQSSLSGWLKRHPERVEELTFGVDADFFTPGPDQRRRFGIEQGAPTIVFVGGLDRAHAFKGLPVLLDAFRFLDPRIHLLVVGDGDLRWSYEERARANGIVSRVHFVGQVDFETLRDAYRSADVLAFPSTNPAEALGLVALEAQACRIPVVASDLPGVRTAVRHQETGLLVPPGNVSALASALSMLLSDHAMRNTLGEQGRAFVTNQLSWDRHIDGLIGVYRRLAKGE
jgi:glycosyltransferase involved in cell wall biosynthesis